MPACARFLMHCGNFPEEVAEGVEKLSLPALAACSAVKFSSLA